MLPLHLMKVILIMIPPFFPQSWPKLCWFVVNFSSSTTQKGLFQISRENSSYWVTKVRKLPGFTAAAIENKVGQVPSAEQWGSGKKEMANLTSRVRRESWQPSLTWVRVCPFWPQIEQWVVEKGGVSPSHSVSPALQQARASISGLKNYALQLLCRRQLNWWLYYVRAGQGRETGWLGSIRKGKKTRGMMVEVFHKGKMSIGHCFWLLFCPWN